MEFGFEEKVMFLSYNGRKFQRWRGEPGRGKRKIRVGEKEWQHKGGETDMAGQDCGWPGMLNRRILDFNP